MGGYVTANGGRSATGVFDPNVALSARSIVIWDNGNPFAIATADVLGFSRTMHQAIRQRVLALRPGWASANFILSATHTHNGPALIERLDPYMAYGLGPPAGPASDLTPVVNYSQWLQDQMVNVVQTALGATQTPCTLDYQVITQNFSFNREGLSYVETAVPVLVARGTGGAPVAVIYSYATHPVSAGQQSQWDGDFPAEASAWIEDQPGHPFALFLQGPIGDQDPVGARGFPLRNELGSQLGHAVISAVASPGRALGDPIVASYQEILLPLDITTTSSNLTAVRNLYQSRESNAALMPWYSRHAQVMIQQINNGSFSVVVPLPLQVWKLQGSPLLRLALSGGELTSGYAVYFRNLYGGPGGLFMCGNANEVPAYVTSNELLRPLRSGGSYGGGWDTDFPGIGGGSMTVYGLLGQFVSGLDGTGREGVEEMLISALQGMLA